MKILLFLLFLFFFACTSKNDFSKSLERNPELSTVVDSLKTTKFIYKYCATCSLSGLKGKQLIGYFERQPPTGDYYKKEVDIGEFKFEAYLILDSKTDERTNGYLYICHFNQEQKEKFLAFSPFYHNRIAHYKQLINVDYVGNTVIIHIDNQDF